MGETTRRTVLTGAAGLSAAMALAACSKKEDVDTDPDTGAATPTATGTGDAGAAALAAVADIPVGGGKIFEAQKVVVTQPTANEIKAFSATCTHMACLVSEVKDGTINCKCHNSKYKIADGSVAQGPATRPLPAATVKVENGKITLG